MKNLYCTLFLSLLTGFSAIAQVPVITSINGPSAVCSLPSSVVNTFSAQATNSPSNYFWNAMPAAGVSFGGPPGAVQMISFPNTNLTYTLYVVATNGSGASNTGSFVVTVFETPTITFSGNNSFCQGSATNLSASSTILYSASSSLSYSWSPSTGLNTTSGPNVVASPPVTTTYTVQVFLGFCANTYQVTVFAKSSPVVSVSSSPLLICAGEPSTLTIGGNASLLYLNFSPSPSSVVVFPTAPTTYTIMGLANNGCATYASITQNVSQCVGIKAQEKSYGSVSIYPNPNNGTFMVRSMRTEKVYISNELGQVMRQMELVANEDAEIRELPPGIYFVITGISKSKIIVTR